MFQIRFYLLLTSVVLLSTLSTKQQCSAVPLFGTSTTKGGSDNDESIETQDTNEATTKEEEEEERVEQETLAANIARLESDETIFDSTEDLRNSIVDEFFGDDDDEPPQDGDNNHYNDHNDHEPLSLKLKREVNILSNTPSLTTFLQTTRRQLHRHPELMYQEHFTSQTIQTILTQLQIPFTTGWSKNAHPDLLPGSGGYGIVADIGSGQPPCVLLRADMDALPIYEKTPSIPDFVSRSQGKMHACGHDGHVTMLLGAAALLKGMEQSLPGTVRLMFQPAEEGGAGGKRMVEEGVTSIPPIPQMAFGMHVWPALPSGTIASRPGPLLAAATQFQVEIVGVSGHAAMPHQTVDPVVAASSMVLNLQTIVSRTLSPLEAGVVSITSVIAGEGSFNVIPAVVTMKGTIRALAKPTMELLKERVDAIATNTAMALGCNATVVYSPDPYPPTVNNPDLFETFSKGVGGLISPEGQMRIVEPTMGGEDFSFLGEVVPSTFFLLGQGSGGSDGRDGPKTNLGLHNEKFALDESVLPLGVELHVNLALRALKKLGNDESDYRGSTTSEL